MTMGFLMPRAGGLVAAIVFVASAWLTLVVVTPSWEASGRPAGLRLVASTFRLTCARVCHQNAERSFHTDGRPWPVCARCSGLYAGAALGAWFAARDLWRRRGAGWRAEAYRWPLTLAAIPTALTWALEYIGWLPVSNEWRFAAALPLGAFAAWLVTSMVAGTVE